MSCYNPKKGFVVGFTKDLKPKLRILGNEYNSIDKFGVPKRSFGSDEDGDYTSYYVIPCGHCLGCRQDQANQWTNRLLLESKNAVSVYFVTLTYDNDHLHAVAETDPETGEFFGGFTLCKRDCQLFFKRLRRANPDDKIRYYLAGEYGPNTGRPHYHAILFGYTPDDLQPFGVSETGNQYYISNDLSSAWSLGFVSIEPANEFTIRYVTGYVTKKLGEYPNEVFEKRGLQPPFAVASRRPGIGYEYLKQHIDDIISKDKIIVSTANGAIEFDPPRYFRKKLSDIGYEEQMLERSRKKIRFALDDSDARSEKTDLNDIELLKIKEYNHVKRVRQRDKL